MRLSDFQIADAPIVVDQHLMARNAKAARRQVNWKKTRTTATEGANAPYVSLLMDADSDSDEEPEASDSNEEPAEEMDAKAAFDSFCQLLSNDAALKALVTSKRPAVVDREAATVIASPHKVKINHSAGYITDAQYISKFLHPEMLCCDAEKQLHDISFERQKNDANRSYWSGLYFYLRDQPLGSKIKDIPNQVCLSNLLAHTLGGQTTFGV